MRMALSNPDPKPRLEAVTLGEGGFLHHSFASLSPSNGGGLGAGGLRSRCAAEKTGMGARWLGQGPQEPPLS